MLAKQGGPTSARSRRRLDRTIVTSGNASTKKAFWGNRNLAEEEGEGGKKTFRKRGANAHWAKLHYAPLGGERTKNTDPSELVISQNKKEGGGSTRRKDASHCRGYKTQRQKGREGPESTPVSQLLKQNKKTTCGEKEGVVGTIHDREELGDSKEGRKKWRWRKKGLAKDVNGKKSVIRNVGRRGQIEPAYQGPC